MARLPDELLRVRLLERVIVRVLGGLHRQDEGLARLGAFGGVVVPAVGDEDRFLSDENRRTR